MHHPPLTVAELLTDESFISYCRKQNESDIRYWEKFLADHPDQRSVVEEAVNEYSKMFTALAAADLDEQLHALKKKMHSGDAAPVVPLPAVRRRRLPGSVRFAVVAAAVLLVLAGYFVWNGQRIAQPAPAPVHYTSKPGERKTFQLPDGTQVSLNAGSEVHVHAEYGRRTREIFLTGEAFFEVQQNKQVPFIVHTADMDITALGTAFNVRSYTGEKTETALLRGLVEVTLKKENNRKVLLRPEEKISWASAGPANVSKDLSNAARGGNAPTPVAQVKKLDDGSVKEVAWMENKLVFDNDPFEEIAPQLARWYNVSIVLASDAVKQYHFTATFKREKLEQVLDILKTSKPFRYRMDGEKIIITEK